MANESEYPDLEQYFLQTNTGSKVCAYTSEPSQANPETPTLIFIHGYPQSAYIWRHVAPALAKTHPLFIVDVPGYGFSSACPAHDKRTVGTAILESFRSYALQSNKTSSTLPVVLIGHDRGARIAHRLAVDKSAHAGINIQSIVLLDIVPTIIQFDSFSSPKKAQSTFHWSFLANVDLATNMIKSYGGAKWCMEMHYRWAGRHLENTDFPQAVERYSKHFENESVIRASCEDYRAGAEEDSDLQVKDQEEGRKVDVPVFVIYSSEYLGKRYDVNKLWEDWVIPGTEVATFGIEGNVGHFLPEEAPKIVIEKLEDWLSVRA